MHLSFILLFSLLPACAFLHHVQVSDIDQRQGEKWDPIDIKLSEMGIDVKQASSLVKGIARSGKGKKTADSIQRLIGAFQMGPKTGNIVFDDSYAEDLLLRIYEQCPSGKLTGLMSIRETMKYPVISGEIIKVTGYCLRK